MPRGGIRMPLVNLTRQTDHGIRISGLFGEWQEDLAAGQSVAVHHKGDALASIVCQPEGAIGITPLFVLGNHNLWFGGKNICPGTDFTIRLDDGNTLRISFNEAKP
jgi:hypothetical protein